MLCISFCASVCLPSFCCALLCDDTMSSIEARSSLCARWKVPHNGKCIFERKSEANFPALEVIKRRKCLFTEDWRREGGERPQPMVCGFEVWNSSVVLMIREQCPCILPAAQILVLSHPWPVAVRSSLADASAWASWLKLTNDKAATSL